MVKTTQVFTPTKTPTHTSVRRENLWQDLSDLAEQGGAFIPVLGVTKLGKTTLVKALMEKSASVYIPSQELTSGSSSLWSYLAAALEIPSSSTKGKVEGNKAKWGLFGKFGIKVPGLSTSSGAEIGGERSRDTSTGATYEVELSSAVTEAMRLLAENAVETESHPPTIVLDDFHFVTDSDKRREILLALRPVMEQGATLILASLPGREHDEAYRGTNLDGRLAHITVPTWDREELQQIATLGFEALNVSALSQTVELLIDHSYGSPQIMQQLCLNLCRFNNVQDDKSEVDILSAPDDWTAFFRRVKDTQSVNWLNRLGFGLPERGQSRNRFTLKDGRNFDGYQLILWAIHELGSPSEVGLADVTDKIADLVGETPKTVLRRYSLEAKAKNMNVIASRDMESALKQASVKAPEDSTDDLDVEQETFSAEEISVAELIPQPVFEASDDGPSGTMLRIMNPMLAYALAWHPESFETSKR